MADLVAEGLGAPPVASSRPLPGQRQTRWEGMDFDFSAVAVDAPVEIAPNARFTHLAEESSEAPIPPGPTSDLPSMGINERFVDPEVYGG